MKVSRVIGSVVSTNKSEKLRGVKLMVVREVDILTREQTGIPLVAVDTVGAGVGEEVLVVSGSSSRQTTFTENKPVDLAIIAIIDSIEVEGKLVFKK